MFSLLYVMLLYLELFY
uniref:Uncharacterized protein n=1 Tax=Arundo donax TaxID=35708 RepID=A0A0A9HH18_ARUDO